MGDICQLFHACVMYHVGVWSIVFVGSVIQHVYAASDFYRTFLLVIVCWACFTGKERKKFVMKNRIRIERAILNITQAELAERVQVSRQTINAIEAGKYSPTLALGMKIAEQFEKTVNEVFELEQGD
jgi:putative transcriptional regulator